MLDQMSSGAPLSGTWALLIITAESFCIFSSSAALQKKELQEREKISPHLIPIVGNKKIGISYLTY
jgi:hypothetical protein